MRCIEVVTIDNNDIDPRKNFIIELNLIAEPPPNAMTDIRLTNIVIQDNDAPRGNTAIHTYIHTRTLNSMCRLLIKSFSVTDPCSSNNCHADADCVSTGMDSFQCVCRSDLVGDGRICIGRQLFGGFISFSLYFC